MADARTRAGRVIGILIIVQMIGGFLVNFVLEAPLFGPPGFLSNAAPHSQAIALGALVGLLVEMLWVGIAVTANPLVSADPGSLAAREGLPRRAAQCDQRR